jgi:uncharacterized membrane protein YcaP (DUF421 family)
MHGGMLSDMFRLGLPLTEKIVRPILVYFFLVVGLRVAGKRELAQLNAFDLVVLLVLSNTVQNAIIGDDNSVTGGMIGAATLLALNYGVVRFLFRHERIDRWVEGEELVLIDDGRIRHDRLERELITVAELREAAAKQGFTSLEEVERAVLEPSGVLTFAARRPVPDEARHGELLTRLDALTREIAGLRGALGFARSGAP